MPPPTLAAAVHANLAVVRQGRALLARLDTGQYAARLAVCYHASIGAHLRHIVEHYQAFLAGLDAGVIDYEHRPRNRSIEENPAEASAALDALAGELLAGDLRAKAARLINLSALRTDGCRVVSVGGREVFEFCFGPGHEFHLYIAARGDFPEAGHPGEPVIVDQGRRALANWADERHVYSLVTYAGAETLRRLL